jgi:hypothetical protein
MLRRVNQGSDQHNSLIVLNLAPKFEAVIALSPLSCCKKCRRLANQNINREWSLEMLHQETKLKPTFKARNGTSNDINRPF